MANIKISDLSSASLVTDTVIFPMVDSTGTKKVSAAVLKSYVKVGFVTIDNTETVYNKTLVSPLLENPTIGGIIPADVAIKTNLFIGTDSAGGTIKIGTTQGYTFPPYDGTATQVLSTNGSGTLSFVTPFNGSYTTLTNVPVTFPVTTASVTVLGGVKVDGVTVKINNGIIGVSTATAAALGVVKIDGTTLYLNDGTVSATTATTLVKGIVKPDGSTITIVDGTVSATTATTLVKGIVKPDGSTITIVDGTITAPYTYTLPIATTAVIGGVRPDGTTVTINTSTGVISYTLPIATTAVIGGVRPDGTTITINTTTGVISYTLPIATTAVIGGIRPDGTTVTINTSTGVITAPYTYTLPAATTSTIGGVKVDGTTIAIDGNNVISAPSGIFQNSSGSGATIGTIDAALYGLYYHAGALNGQTMNISNLTAGKQISITLRNTNTVSATINIRASATAASHAVFPFSNNGAAGLQTGNITLAANTGQLSIVVANVGGTIFGYFA